VLLAASAHSRSVPNNECLDPGVRRPAVVAEVGSHSSALGVNERRRSFQRLPVDGLAADVTNRALDLAADVTALPVAYGLPRDEGLALPYAVPQIDGEPIYEHERLPNVAADDLVPADVTVRDAGGLPSPPADLPRREHGTTLRHPADDGTADARYDLVALSALSGIDRLAGPTLRFEFAVPGFVEDAVATHLTSPEMPRRQPRHDRPTADVSDPTHRAALADRYGSLRAGDPVDRVVGALREVTAADDAPDGQGLTTGATGVEAVCLLESEASAVPTWGGRVAFEAPPAGDHRLTVDGPGYAPYTQRVAVPERDGAGGEAVRAGVDGAVALAANEAATKVRGEAAGDGSGLDRVALADDFAGRLYEAPPDEGDRFALYAHRGGAYTVEIADPEGLTGAARLNPAPDQATATLAGLRTGKASLAGFLADLLDETLAVARAAARGESVAEAVPERVRGTGDAPRRGRTATGGGPAARGLLVALGNALAAAESAAAAAEAGEAGRADRRLAAVGRRLDGLSNAVEAAGGELSASVARAVERRLAVLETRTERARETPLG
jgi:hypothetical protein